MADRPDWAPLVDEIANALQTALLYSAGFERALSDTAWAQDATDLHRAVDRAARAASRLRDLLGRQG